MSNIRPISLLTCLYKILAKLLADRLTGVLNLIISGTQSALIKGRIITYGVLIAQEYVHSRKLERKSRALLKLDMEKAYDRVNWDVLLEALRCMVFWGKMEKVDKMVHFFGAFSVMVNGNPKGFFKVSRGLRQGDLLSPFLFTIVAEVMSLMIRNVEERGRFYRFKVSETSPLTMTHLQYAADTSMFCDAEVDQIINIRRFLYYCEVVLGFKVNFEKTSLVGVECSDVMLKRLAFHLGCRVEKFPLSCLGMPILDDKKPKSLWDPVLKRVNTKLDSWKVKHLSIGGRAILIQSSMTNLPVDKMSYLVMSSSVSKKIE
ncbi:uncharacterized protein LOC105421166 [Amborella trichopoda]|uniref:uncharacterized protein LOC105421166 n=1 Tax=Amborella trichopoda TaxID=13333 RepID=UPI0005D46777|nr:uncharacterized protein LOC105421166 [Amborella trichopoda]|eukprot:XP_011625849.1 uncharacterized protein LOC105421166 [Amborella trichopoda]